MKKNAFLFALLSAVIFSACTTPSAPTTMRYTLSPLAAENTAAAPAVPFARIAVPAYIDTEQIVTRKSENIVILNETRIWAEPLARTIQRTLPVLVSGKLQGKKLRDFEKISVFIDRLDGTLGEAITVSAQIIVSRLTETATESESIRFAQRIPVPEADDAYAAYAQAISTAVAELAQAVADQVSE